MPVALLLCFVLVPLAEIYVISQIGHLLGLPVTLGMLLLISGVGAVVVEREGLRTWRALRGALASGQMPARALADGALVLCGGVLLLTPGFLTDVVGLLLVLPPTRAVCRRLLTTLAVRQALRGSGRRSGRRRRPSAGTAGSTRWAPSRPAEGMIIEGQVLPDRNPEEFRARDATEPRSR